MGRTLRQWRDDEPLRLLVIAGGSDEAIVEPQIAGVRGPFQACSLNGDVTGNNFHGNYACFDLGIQIGNPAQGAGLSNPGMSHGGAQIFAGQGVPPPISYDAAGNGPTALPLGQVGTFYFQNDGPAIFWYSGSTWIKISV